MSGVVDAVASAGSAQQLTVSNVAARKSGVHSSTDALLACDEPQAVKLAQAERRHGRPLANAGRCRRRHGKQVKRGRLRERGTQHSNSFD